MSLFSKPELSLGVDIGTASIKVVELARSGSQVKLNTFGYADVVTDIVRSSSPETKQKVVAGLKKVLSLAKTSCKTASAALPTYSVFNSIITVPNLSAKDIDSAVRWQAKKYVPLPLEEMVLDWKIVDHPGANAQPNQDVSVTGSKKSWWPFTNKSGNKVDQDKEKMGNPDSAENGLRILVTAAPKNLVSRYLDIFKAAGIKLSFLETEAAALSRSLIGLDKSTVMIVDLGSITTDLSVIEAGIPILNRSINIGGLTVTRSIADSLNISLDRAEQFKRDFGISLSQSEGAKGIPKTIITSLGPVINEVKYVFDLYQSQGQKSIEKIILTGGSAYLPNFVDYISNLFNKPTIVGNPWDRLVYPQALEPILQENGPRLSVAIGLALRNI